MEDNTEKTGAADNTAVSGGEDQSLLDPQAAGAAPEAAPAEGAPAPAAEEKDGAEAPLLSPEPEKPAAEEKAQDRAPETYGEFQLPEGFELSGQLLEETTTLFKGMNLSQEKAQKLVDFYTKRMIDEKAAGLNELAARRKAWRAEVRQRPEYQAERGLALRGMRAVITDPDEKELFTDSWMSDHPALWKVFVKIGRLVGEDSPPKGDGGGAPDRNINMQRFPNA